jgi:hypothetical protein
METDAALIQMVGSMPLGISEIHETFGGIRIEGLRLQWMMGTHYGDKRPLPLLPVHFKIHVIS